MLNRVLNERPGCYRMVLMPQLEEGWCSETNWGLIKVGLKN